MKLWQYISLVGLIGAVPLFIVSMMLIKASYSQQIDFELQELQGNRFLRPLEQLLTLVPRYQEAERRQLAGETSPEFDPSQVRQQLDQALGVLATNYNGRPGKALRFSDSELALRQHDNARLSLVQATWANLKQAPPAVVAGGNGIARLTGCVRAMILHAGDTSNLILDDELDSYYLMDITVSGLPETQQRLADITAQTGAWLRDRRTPANKIQVAEMATMLRQDVDRIDRDAHTSLVEDRYFRGISVSLQKNLPPAIEKFNAECLIFLKLLDQVAADGTVFAAEFETAGWNAQAESSRLWQTDANELDELLARRIHNIETGRLEYYMIVTGTFCFVALAMGLIIRKLLQTHDAELSKSAEGLSAKEAQLRVIGDNLPDGVVYEILRDFDGTMRFLYVSAGVERLNGLAAEAVLRDSSLFHEQIFPEDRSKLLAARQASLANRSVLDVVVRIRRQDGDVRWMRLSSTPRRLPDGRFIWDGIETDITERKLAEEALQASENRFRTLIEKAPMAISISRDGTRIYTNQKFLELFGYQDGNELVGRPIINQWAPESRAMIEEYARRRSQGLPAPTIYEAVGQHRNGSRIPIQIAVTVVELPDGAASIGFATDISERKRAELQVQHLNRVYAVLSDINETIVREKNPQTMLQAACKIAVKKGKFSMAWIGMRDNAKQLLNPVAFTGAADGFLEMSTVTNGLAGRSILAGEHVVCNDLEHDPSYAPWREEALQRGYRSSCALPLKVAGRVAGVFCLYASEQDFFSHAEMALLDELATDIGFALEFHEQDDRRREAEAAVKQSEARFSRMFHNNPVPISLIRFADGVFIDANESFLRMSGFTREEVIGHTALELNVYPDPSVRERLMKHLQEHGHLYAHEQFFRTKSGAIRHHFLWFDSITVNDEKCLLVIAMDITEQKQAERRQKQLEEQLRQTQKLEALGTLAGGIAHDFNNILGAIISFAELSRMDNTNNAELQENLGEVLKASNRATSLVRQILSFSRQQKQERTHLQMAPVVKEALKLLRATLPATIEIDANLNGQLPDVLANPTQIHQVVMNLCTNAGHAMRNMHGKLTVTLNLARLDADSMPPVELKPGHYVRLTVSDTGRGMDAGTVERIFEPFFTTKAPGEGTGLGLSVVHGIVTEHNAQIMVDSVPGAGTTFTIFFPPVAAAEKGDELPPLAAPPGNGETVMFVDDEPALGVAAQKMMRRLGYQAVIFSDAEAAWEAVQKTPAAFDVLVTDLTMPVMTGMELACRVLEICPQKPVILISGYSGALTKAKAQEKGVRELLGKPLDYQLLAGTLHKVLHPSSNSK